MATNAELARRLGKAEGDIDIVKVQLQRLSDGVVTNNLQTGEMYEVFNSLRGGFAVIEWLGKAIKPLLFIGGFVAAGYAFLKTGVWGKP